MNIHFFLRSSKKNKLGEMPICFCLRINKKQNYYSTGFKSVEDCWDDENQTANKKHKQYAIIKNGIAELTNRFELLRNNFELEGKEVDFETFKNLLLQKSTLIKTYSLENISKEYTQMYEKRVKANIIQKCTLDKAKNYFKNINLYFECEYINKKNIMLNEIIRGDFEKMKLYLLTDKKFKINYISKLMSFFKGFLSWAVDNDYLQKNVFNNLAVKQEDTEAIALNLIQLEALEKKEFSTERLTRIKDFFLFACYTGLSFADVKNFTKENIENVDGRDCINMNRKKTKNFFFVPLTKKALVILEKYNYNLKVPSNGKYNEYLKEIQTLCEFKENLTTHVARKTFINIMMTEYNMKDYEVAQIVGHTSVSTTKKYYIQKDTLKKSILKSMENVK